jgi:hypothetical protein
MAELLCLDDYLIHEILSYLVGDQKSLAQIALVCRRFGLHVREHIARHVDLTKMSRPDLLWHIIENNPALAGTVRHVVTSPPPPHLRLLPNLRSLSIHADSLEVLKVGRSVRWSSMEASSPMNLTEFRSLKELVLPAGLVITQLEETEGPDMEVQTFEDKFPPSLVSLAVSTFFICSLPSYKADLERLNSTVARPSSALNHVI